MPMMAAYEYSDARNSARELAERTLEGLRDREAAPSNENAINNMYRLLQGYRSHHFYGYGEQVQPEHEGIRSDVSNQSDRNVGELAQAIGRTFHDIYGTVDLGTAMDGMKTVLRTVAYPEDGAAELDEAEVDRTEQFFVTLLHNLEA